MARAPPEWVIPNDTDTHLIKAIISACSRGSVDTFQKLYKLKGSRLIPPSYLVRLATTSRWPPMLEYIFKIHPLGRLQSDVRSRSLDTVRSYHDRMTDLWYSVLSAIGRGDLEIVELFLKGGMPLMPLVEDSYNRVETLLEQAIRDDQVEVVALLLNYGANPNECVWGLSGGTCLGLAAMYSRHAMVRLMMEHGGKIEDSRALLIIAGMFADVEAAQTVLDCGADVNQIFTWYGQQRIVGTALHQAAKTNADMHAKSMEFARWLLDNGADHTIRNWDGKTAQQVAEEHGNTQFNDMITNWIR